MSIDISFVLTVYNKSNYLEHTIRSLQNQKGGFSRQQSASPVIWRCYQELPTFWCSAGVYTRWRTLEKWCD